MNIKTVSVTYERKQNLGDFSSANVGCTLWADVEEGEDLHQVMNGLWVMAKNNVKAQLLPLTKNNGSMTVENLFLGLPIELQSISRGAFTESEKLQRQALADEDLSNSENWLKSSYEDDFKAGY